MLLVKFFSDLPGTLLFPFSRPRKIFSHCHSTAARAKTPGHQQTLSLIGSKLLFVSQRRPRTVSNCSEGAANWGPSGKGLNERIHIVSLHESDVTSLQNEITGP